MVTTVISIFRNSISYIDRYAEQILALHRKIDLEVHVAEGDSDDGTYEQMAEVFRTFNLAGIPWSVEKIEHGGPKFRSVDNPQRWGQIAYVYNALLDNLDPEGPVILVESDLIWQPETMLALLTHLDHQVDAAAPLSVKGDRFYDTWGHRWPDGTPFTSNLDEVVSDGKMLRPISSAGSCIAMKEAVARKARFGETDGIVGFCRNLHELGFHLYLDDLQRVEHP